jgi:hypothetical protein
MERLIIIFIITLFVTSCKKDPQIVQNATNPTIEQSAIDYRLGNYSCLEITHSVNLDSLGHIITYIDTSNTSVTVNVAKWDNANYLVSINTYTYSFYTSTSNSTNTIYYAQCYNGPCSDIRFNSDSSITVYWKWSNPVSKYYVGKKQ